MCVVAVPFSLQRVVYVVKLVSDKEVVCTDEDVVATEPDELLPYCEMLAEEETVLAELDVP